MSDLLEVMLLLKEVGLLRGTLEDGAVSDLIVSPLFETIGDLRNAAPIMRAFYAQQAHFFQQQHHFEQVAHVFGVRDDVVAQRLAAVTREHLDRGFEDREFSD